jgi:hypothetical protein
MGCPCSFEAIWDMISLLTHSPSEFAHFITLCSAYMLAGTRYISSPWQGSSPAKTRVSSRPSRAHGHHLRPSTNG